VGATYYLSWVQLHFRSKQRYGSPRHPAPAEKLVFVWVPLEHFVEGILHRVNGHRAIEPPFSMAAPYAVNSVPIAHGRR
jgi:hypothetical protein